ncbi:MAG: branched-chain amino acid ABC transporter permease [Frankiaceae bacterium]|nr:branched-chain amino acid ABC transporter permease [Frankiaceae bacterium]MBV9872047.1 branched-chain amino acid ABC transporter permease [Frankiaceae bacterium]
MSQLRPHLPLLKRLAACLFGGFIGCLMVGNQEGSQSDFGLSFNAATAPGRLVTFLLLGVAVFALMTFWDRISDRVTNPGAVTVATGMVFAGVGMTLLKWYDPLGKFSKVSTAVGHSSGAPTLVKFYFAPTGWVLLAVAVVLGGAAVATRRAVLGYLELAYGLAVGVIVFIAHSQMVNFGGGIDHSLGVFSTTIGYFVFALSGLIVVRSTADVAAPREAIERVLDWRPGLPLAAAGLLLGLLSFFGTSWFAPQQKDWHFHATQVQFKGTGLAQPAAMYLAWLGPVLFAVTAVAVIAGAYLRLRPVSAIGAALGLVSVILTVISLDKITTTGTHAAPEYGKFWANLGAGGWLACLAFSLMCGGGLLAVQATRRPKRAATVSSDQVGAAPGTSGSAINRSVVVASVAFVLFYPPTLPLDWQTVVVTQIAAYLLLAVGLNVVVGWAGLLDLGYIAFFGIGSYSAAFFAGALPLKPPDWLHLSPLWVIPLAIVACLIAGVLLGFPTLRLRGDYLAIVTLGFGEIVQLFAINNPGNLTGGPIGPRPPHPAIHVGPLHVVWGLDSLPYWYLLLVLLGITMFAFHRLENSRTGRAWAAIREDEVAAQATGIRTTRAKLLAFAIGASTSGVAGVFSGSTIGYFDPSNFGLQESILIVAYVVFGGMGSLAGAVAGAAVLTWLPYFLQSQVPLPDSQMWIGAVVMIMMIFRPAGLIPAKRRRAELGGLGGTDSAEVAAVPAAGAL